MTNRNEIRLFYETVNLQETKMSFIKIRFSNELGNIDAEFRRGIDEMFRLINSTFTIYQNVWRPQVDIYESPDEIMILADVAGVNKEDLYVEIDHRVLRIYGKRKKPLMENTRYHLAEIPYGYFERNLSLPCSVDTDSLKATYADGLLQIWMAKLPVDKVCKIPVQKNRSY
jgi:HSP20 family protein